MKVRFVSVLISAGTGKNRICVGILRSRFKFKLLSQDLFSAYTYLIGKNSLSSDCTIVSITSSTV